MTTDTKDKMGDAFKSWRETDESSIVDRVRGLIDNTAEIAYMAGYMVGYKDGGDSAIATLEKITR